MKMRVLAILLSAGGLCHSAFGDCTASPSVGVSLSPHPDGTVTVTVPYSFPDTVDGSQRSVSVLVTRAGAPGTARGLGSFRPGQVSGTWIIEDQLFCEPSDTYTYTASAGSCGIGSLTASANASNSLNADPSVSLEYLGPDDLGLGKVRVTYDFPNTAAADQRSLQHSMSYGINGLHGGPTFHPPDRQGIWEFDFPMTCWPSGEYVHHISAQRCTQQPVDHDDATIAVNGKPSVSIEASKPNEEGRIPLTVTWGFPNTGQPSDRAINVYRLLSGNTVAGVAQFHAQEQYGTWSGFADAPCEKGPIRVLAVAQSCTFEQDQQETSVDLAADPKVSIALTKGEVVNEVTGYRPVIVTIDYDMGDGKQGWHVGLDLMKAVLDGQTFPRQTIFTFTPAQQKGTVTYIYQPAPELGQQQLTFYATASTCSGKAEDFKATICTCEGASADPVHLSDGNVRVTDVDALPLIGGERLVRTYNSDEQVVSWFGRGWTSFFDQHLVLDVIDDEQVLTFFSPANDVTIFRGTAGTSYRQVFPRNGNAVGTLQYDATTASYLHRPSGSNEIARFRASDGLLLALRDAATGREAQVAYNTAGHPHALTDSWTGTSWTLTVDATRLVITSVAVSGRPDLVWSYSYDPDGNLTTVTAPGSAVWRTYEYAAKRMTASRDALGNLIESHTYDAGFGNSSTGPQDEIADIQYNLAGSTPDERVTRVTYKTGTTADYVLQRSGSGWMPVRVTGGCSACGNHDVTYARDARGRIVREQDARGFITASTYDPVTHNLIARSTAMQPFGCDPETDASRCRLTAEALGDIGVIASRATLTTLYEYGDAAWRDRPTVIRTESLVNVLSKRSDEQRLGAEDQRWRVEAMTYDGATGAVLAHAVSGWSAGEYQTRTTTRTLYNGSEPAVFAPGGAFQTAWLSLPQPKGLLKSSDGPRTDVADVTTYVYYPIDASVPAEMRGHLAASRDALGHIMRVEAYDVFGNILRTVDANGVRHEATFDALGRNTGSIVKGIAGCDTAADPLCATDLASTVTYSGAGPVTSEIRAGGGGTAYAYDARGRVQTVSRGPSATDLKERIETSYDPATGKKNLTRLLALENGLWVEKQRESFTYDVDGLLHRQTHAGGTFVEYGYDSAQQLISTRDENHSEPNTHYSYDPGGRLERVVQTLASAADGVAVTRYAYDSRGNLAGVTDPNGNTTSYLYDDFDQLVKMISPVTGESSYTYDAAGQLVSTTDANGTTTTRSYDAIGRVLTAVTTAGAAQETIGWSYDAGALGVGRLTSMTDPSGSTSYRYERRGMLASEIKTIEGTAYTATYGYDADGNRARIAYPSGRIVTYGFDFAGRPVAASLGNAPLVTSAQYLPFGPLRAMTMGNGTTKTMSWDARYRPVTNALTLGGETLASYGYTHDDAGNIIELDDLVDRSFDRAFHYDDLNRLTGADTTEALWGSGSYSYDAMGNMLTATLGRDSARAFAYRDTTPSLASVSVNGEARSVAYDAVGNELAAGAVTYTYTPRNHLASDPRGSDVYDGRGLRTIALRSTAVRDLVCPPRFTGATRPRDRCS